MYHMSCDDDPLHIREQENITEKTKTVGLACVGVGGTLGWRKEVGPQPAGGSPNPQLQQVASIPPIPIAQEIVQNNVWRVMGTGRGVMSCGAPGST